MTTLANIAELAHVPLGNVYYYFKSKESIAQSVIDRRRNLFNGMVSEWEKELDEKNRIQAFIRHAMGDAQEKAQYGDSLGSLCQELGKLGDNQISNAAADLMKDIIGWVEKQFLSMGKGEKSSGLATNLVSVLQGLSLLTVTFKDPDYMHRQDLMLSTWLEAV